MLAWFRSEDDTTKSTPLGCGRLCLHPPNPGRLGVFTPRRRLRRLWRRGPPRPAGTANSPGRNRTLLRRRKESGEFGERGTESGTALTLIANLPLSNDEWALAVRRLLAQGACPWNLPFTCPARHLLTDVTKTPAL